jgi:tetratricopeptide (TPR) repeat protein
MSLLRTPRSRRLVRRLLLGVALSCAGARLALPAEPTGLADGVRAYRAGDFRTAEQLFRAALAEQPQSAAALFNLGLSQYRLGDFAAARRSFLALRAYPEMTAVAEYHLGLVAARTGQPERAAGHLRAAAAGGDDRLRRLARAALEMLGERPVALVPAAYALLALGADSNRNRLDEDYEIPGRDTEGAYHEFSGVLQYPLGWMDDLELRSNLFQRDYLDDDALDQRSAQVSLRKSWRFGHWQLSTAPGGEVVHLDQRGVVSSLGLALQAVRRAGSMTFRARYEPAQLWAEPEIDYLEGTRQRLDLGYEMQFGRVLLALGYDVEDNSDAARALDDVSGTQPPLRHGPRLRLSRALTPRLTLDLNAAWHEGRYRDIDSPFFAIERRIDDQMYLGSTLRWRLGESWGLRLDYRFYDNESTLELYDYDRHMAQLGVDWRY